MVAAAFIGGLSLPVGMAIDRRILLFGVPLAVVCLGVALAILAVRGRLVGVEVTREAVIWEVRYGPLRVVRWDDVVRIVRFTRRGRDAAIQLVTDRGVYTVVPAEYEDARRLAGTLELHGALIEQRLAEDAGRPFVTSRTRSRGRDAARTWAFER